MATTRSEALEREKLLTGNIVSDIEMTEKKGDASPASKDGITSKLISNLSSDEKKSCVIYASENVIAAGAVLKFPRISINVRWDAIIAFVDLHPTANWSHSCRYILLKYDASELCSFEAQFPPFQSERQIRWRLLYKAPSVPDAAVAGNVKG